MLKAQGAANCEEDNTPTLLGDMQLTLSPTHPNHSMFVLSPDETSAAFHADSASIMEEQAYSYFGGYILRKVMEFHGGQKCATCGIHGELLTKATKEVEDRAFFTWLKRYDRDCKLYSTSQEFSCFVKDVTRLVTHCLQKRISEPRILDSLNHAVMTSVPIPTFCCTRIKDKAVSLVVRTLFYYNLKWLNDTIKSSTKTRARKLKILYHV